MIELLLASRKNRGEMNLIKSTYRKAKKAVYLVSPPLNNKVLIGTHHKTGTVWMLNVFREIAGRYALKFISPSASSEKIMLEEDFDIFLQDHSLFDLENVDGYRGFHIIRDPRDVIVSGCFYHLKSSEPWLHQKKDSFGGLTYQEKISSFPNLDDQILFEMENAAYRGIKDIASWNYQNPNFIEIKYEDLIQDTDLKLFKGIFDFLGFRNAEMKSLLEIAYDNSLFSNRLEKTKHIRSGKTQQWKTIFTEQHRARFVELFGDVLVQLGYEEDNEQWLQENM
ncbi:MAG: sulfotransferase domain-containing protein [Phormidesmis sp.]